MTRYGLIYHMYTDWIQSNMRKTIFMLTAPQQPGNTNWLAD